MAVLLVATLVVPLSTVVQSTANRAYAMRKTAAGFYEVVSSRGGLDAWEWGPTVESVGWVPGPELRVNVRAEGGSAAVVGLWTDGWFLGEWPVDPGSDTVVEAPIWSGRKGAQLVIRVREREGSWGPPWRSVVPDAYGDIWTGFATADNSAAEANESSEARTVAHVFSLGNPALGTSWTDTRVAESVLGLTFLLPYAGAGHCEVELGGRTQSWPMYEGRALDVYF